MNNVVFRDFKRSMVYHSPQYPGYTCWCGLWMMPDSSVMLSFNLFTGPFSGRDRVSDEIGRLLSWPPAGHKDWYDMTGLEAKRIYLRSTDQGISWQQVAERPFKTCINGAVGGGPEVALTDGTILQGIWGPYLPYDDVPRTEYLERSVDGAKNWSGQEIIYRDKNYRFWANRLRFLNDGRLVASGAIFPDTPEFQTRDSWAAAMEPALFVSDDEGNSWDGPIKVLKSKMHSDMVYTEELDFVELDNGDLLIVLRVEIPGSLDASGVGNRTQLKLIKSGDTWLSGVEQTTPFPHDGQPELLKTNEGLIFHIATGKLFYTSDEGQTWQEMAMPDRLDKIGSKVDSGSGYYPKAVQLNNGQVLCVGHVGRDNGYGQVDQSITAMRFSIEVV